MALFSARTVHENATAGRTLDCAAGEEADFFWRDRARVRMWSGMQEKHNRKCGACEGWLLQSRLDAALVKNARVGHSDAISSGTSLRTGASSW